MPRKPLELPPEVARAFVRDMKAFFACGHDTIKADGIAAMQLHALKQHYDGKLRLIVFGVERSHLSFVAVAQDAVEMCEQLTGTHLQEAHPNGSLSADWMKVILL